jgi:hypothetical protein
MIDNGVQGCCWCEFPGGTYAVRSASRRVSHCQLELDIVYDSLVAHEPLGAWQTIAPLRILSFDIECMGRKGAFPDAEHDPVIQIASVVTLQGASSSIIRNVMTLGATSPIVGAQVLAFEREEELLNAWAAFVREADPDVVTGYNVQNFDLPYLLNRARKLKCEPAQLLGRIRGVKAAMRDTTFSSSAHGKHENVETTIDGRVVFDMLQYMRRDHKLSSYSLNSVSAHFLGQQKEDVHHSIIGDRGKGDTPNSSDGVVPYWSSHLATAKSEKIVPGLFGCDDILCIMLLIMNDEMRYCSKRLPCRPTNTQNMVPSSIDHQTPIFASWNIILGQGLHDRRVGVVASRPMFSPHGPRRQRRPPICEDRHQEDPNTHQTDLKGDFYFG